jgi:CBS domain containing-hemolysin-like protein
MIRAIFQMDRTPVREIMVPRVDIVAVESDATLMDVLDLAVSKGYSRIPLYQETIDQVKGMIYVKDLLPPLRQGNTTISLTKIARPAYFIPETMMVDDLLRELQQRRVHIAVVVDEYGGTSGVITIEDLLEEIVGEIEDEYDTAELAVEHLNEMEAVVDARVSIDALNQMFDLKIEGEGFDTVGGFVYQRLGKIPSVGDEVRTDGAKLSILSTLGRRIKKVKVTKAQDYDGEQQPERPSQLD